MQTAISYSLLINDSPSPQELIDALQQIEMEDHCEMASILRLSIAIAPKDAASGWTVLDDDLFPRFAKINLKLSAGIGLPEPMIEAYVIEAKVDFSNQPGRSVLNVIAMDSTILMNLQEKVQEWPDMADSDIASAIFSLPEYNFQSVVEPTGSSHHETDQKIIQRGTDIQFLKDLARRNGYECYVESNLLTGEIEGHFHPAKLDQGSQGVLSVNMGAATNVNSFNLRYDMIRSTATKVTGLEVETLSDQPARADSQSQTLLGGESTLGSDKQRLMLLSRTGMARTGELQTYAQAIADKSSWTITAEGEINTVSYGGILRAKRPVNVRGLGPKFSGTYYVEKVAHLISGDGYTQRFSLRRNAIGLTGKEIFVDENVVL